MKVTMPDSGAAHVIGSKCLEAGIDEVTVSFVNDYDKTLVYITNFSANPEQDGHGTKAMQFICSIADVYGYNLVLKPYKANIVVLDKFYPRFGFKYANDAEMLRMHSGSMSHQEDQVDENINLMKRVKKWLQIK